MDTKKALQVLGMAVLYPDTHYQGNWIVMQSSEETVTAEELRTNPSGCGTTLCYAGFAAAMFAPGDALFSSADEENFYVPSSGGNYVLIHEYNPYEGVEELQVTEYDPFEHRGLPRFDRISVMEFAQGILELEPAQATFLFSGDNTVERLKDIIRYLMTHPHADAYDLSSEFGSVW